MPIISPQEPFLIRNGRVLSGVASPRSRFPRSCSQARTRWVSLCLRLFCNLLAPRVGYRSYTSSSRSHAYRQHRQILRHQRHLAMPDLPMAFSAPHQALSVRSQVVLSVCHVGVPGRHCCQEQGQGEGRATRDRPRAVLSSAQATVQVSASSSLAVRSGSVLCCS